MFQLIVGCLLLLFTAGLIINYLPKLFLSWYVCLLCGLTGAISIFTGGGSWIFQLIQIGAQLTIAVCGLFYLHHQKVLAVRRKKEVMARKQFRQKNLPKQNYLQNQAVNHKRIAQQESSSIGRCA